MTEAFCFSSFEDAETFITNHEIRTFTKYVMIKRSLSDPTTSIKGKVFKGPLPNRIFFEEGRGLRLIEYDGVPFIQLGSELRECHMGPMRKRMLDSKKKKKKAKEKDSKKKSTMEDKTVVKKVSISTQQQKSTVQPQAPVVRVKTMTFEASSNEPISLARGLINQISKDPSTTPQIHDCLQAVNSFLDCSESQIESLRSKLRILAPNLALHAREAVIPRSATGLYSIEIEKKVPAIENDEDKLMDGPAPEKKQKIDWAEPDVDPGEEEILEENKSDDKLDEKSDEKLDDKVDSEQSEDEEIEVPESKKDTEETNIITKNADCRAQIKLKAVMRFPRFKITGVDNKYARNQAVNKIRDAFAFGTMTEEDQEYRIYVCFNGDHTGHSIGQESSSTLPVDPIIIKKIRELVREHGMIPTSEMKRHLDNFRRTLPDLPQHTRFLPTTHAIRNHMQLAATSLISKTFRPRKRKSTSKKKTEVTENTNTTENGNS